MFRPILSKITKECLGTIIEYNVEPISNPKNVMRTISQEYQKIVKNYEKNTPQPRE